MKIIILFIPFLIGCHPSPDPHVYHIDNFRNGLCRYYYNSKVRDGKIIEYETVEDSCGRYEIGDEIK